MTLALLLVTALLLGPVSILYTRGTWRWAYPRLALAGWWMLGVATIATFSLACLSSELHVDWHLSRLARVSTYHDLTGFGAVVFSLWINVMVGSALSLLIHSTKAWRDRRHHRRVLDLLFPASMSTIHLPHDAPVAYYLPGGRGRVVVSEGLMRDLGDDTNVVVAHEHAHRRQGHSPLLLPFTSFSRHLQWLPFFRLSSLEVPLLAECAADDYAASRWGVEPLIRALSRLTESRAVTPACAMAMGDLALELRTVRWSRDFAPRGMWSSVIAMAIAFAGPVLGVVSLH